MGFRLEQIPLVFLKTISYFMDANTIQKRPLHT